MTSTTQSSKRLLSILIRLSHESSTTYHPLSTAYRSIRLFSTTVPPRLSSNSPNNSQAPLDEDAAQLRTEVAGGGSPIWKPRRTKVPVPATSEDIEMRTASPSSRPKSRRSIAPKHKLGVKDTEAASLKSKVSERMDAQPPIHNSFQRAREHWQMQKDALKVKFGEQGWKPRKKLSPDTMEGIRALHEQFPQKYTTPVLAEQFKVSPEAIRRILKSKWRPPPEKMEERRARWAKRHDRIWDAQAEMGLRPQRKKDRQPEGPEKVDDIISLMPDVGP